MNLRRIISLPVVLLFLSLFYLPLLKLLFDSMATAPSDPLSFIFPEGRVLQLLSRSVFLALAVSAASCTGGLFIAFSLYCLPGRLSRALTTLILFTLPLPPYIYGLAWMYALSSLNTLLGQLALPAIPTSGLLPSIIVDVMARLPIAAILLRFSIDLTGRDLIEAALIKRPLQTLITSIIMPLLSPFLAASWAVIFALTIVDYSVSSLFDYNIYSFHIFTLYSSDYNACEAFLASLPLSLISLAALLPAMLLFRRAALSGSSRRNPGSTPFTESPGFFMHLSSFLLIALQSLVPIVFLAANIQSPASLKRLLPQFSQEIMTTGIIALCSVFFALVFGWFLADFMEKERRLAGIMFALLIIPVAAPSSISGIAISHFWNTPSRSFVYESLVMCIMLAIVRFTPYAAFIIYMQKKRVEKSLFEAAQVMHPGVLKRNLSIHVPLMLPGLFAAAYYVLILAAGELEGTIILIPPGCSTLTLTIYNYLHYGSSDIVSSLCFTVLLLSGSVSLILLRGGSLSGRK